MTYKSVKKSVKSITKVVQEIKSIQKSPPAKNLHHVETSQSNRNASKLRALFVCLLSLFQVGTYNSIKTNENQPSGLYKM